ncbi:MAG: hypothetical protein HYZ16_11095 [Bacteroidetes bacterium]|nr:hypothetical protein [Bacteroidota bacterium]
MDGQDEQNAGIELDNGFGTPLLNVILDMANAETKAHYYLLKPDLWS